MPPALCARNASDKLARTMSDDAEDLDRHAPAGSWSGCMSSDRLVILVASAGGLEPIREVLSLLPADFPAAIAVVQHRGADAPERLIELLAARTSLKVRHAADGTIPEAGTVYVCPPGVHMLAERSLRLVPGPKINFVRPNADLVLDSIARVYGDRAACVILSGAGWDGAVGSLALARAGGAVIVQEPDSCAFSGMPTAAVKVASGVAQLPPAAIAAALREMASTPTRTLESARVATTDAPVATRILLADDHRILLEGLNVLIGGQHDMEVVGLAESGEGALRQASRLAPDVVVMDVCMPGMDGIQATRQIVAEAPTTKIVALSSRSDALTMSQILRAGARGYLTKQRAFEELVEAIRCVNQHQTYFSSDVAPLVAAGRVLQT
jgi:two-component system, chemotaxis family, protein-glutamate methylesterase/glutaminase